MNRDRRKQISSLRSDITDLVGKINDEGSEDWPNRMSEIADFHDRAEAIRSDEEEYLENMPESIRNGDKGDTVQGAVDALNNAVEALEKAGDLCDDESPDMGEVTEALEEAETALDEAEAT